MGNYKKRTKRIVISNKEVYKKMNLLMFGFNVQLKKNIISKKLLSKFEDSIKVTPIGDDLLLQKIGRMDVDFYWKKS